MVRAAAKNFRDVLVVVSPARLRAVLDGARRARRAVAGVPLRPRAHGVRAHRRRTTRAIAVDARDDHGAGEDGPRRATGDRHRSAPIAPACSSLPKIRDLRYGENPHQPAAWYARCRRRARRRRRCCRARSCRTPTCSISTPPRASRSSSPSRRPSSSSTPTRAAPRPGRALAEAYVRAREADALAAFGGIVGLNRPIDVAHGRGDRLDVHRSGRRAGRGRRGAADSGEEGRTCAWSSPSFDGARRRRRARAAVDSRRRARAGARRGDARRGSLDRSARPGSRSSTKRQPTAAEWQALRFAWRVCAHVKSNTVIFTAADRTLAIGAGQMSRVDAVKVAVMKAAQPAPDLLRGIGRGLGRVLPVPRRARCRRRRRRDGRRAAGRIGARRGGRSPPPTSTAWRWCSRGGGTSGTDVLGSGTRNAGARSGWSSECGVRMRYDDRSR